MSSGAIQLAMNRTRVTIDGTEVAPSATVTVRGGEAVAIDRGASVELRMAVASITRSRRDTTVVGTDGTTWTLVRRSCGCGR